MSRLLSPFSALYRLAAVAYYRRALYELQRAGHHAHPDMALILNRLAELRGV